MKNRFFAFLLVISTFLFFFGSFVLAQEQTPTPEPEKPIVEVKKGEVINRDFFAVGESVTISGVVNGDVYAAGGSITVDGTINGDLMAAGGIVSLLGEVSDDVRVAGGNILINGTIGKSLSLAGGSVIITSETTIDGSLLAFAGMVDVRGPIGREANVFAGRAVFANQVGGDLKGAIEDLVLTSEAQILGDLEYQSEEEAEIDEDALVVGETIRKPPEEKEVEWEKIAPQIQPVMFGLGKIKLYLNFFSFLISLILGLIFIYLFPKRAEGIAKIISSRPWGSLGVALLTFILLSVALVVLAITIVGIPLALLVIPVFAFLVYFSKIFTSLVVGRWFLLRFGMKRGWNWALLVGLIVYYLLGLITVIGALTGFVYTTLGLGAFLLDQKALRRPSRKRA